jgi:hypothetical protein
MFFAWMRMQFRFALSSILFRLASCSTASFRIPGVPRSNRVLYGRFVFISETSFYSSCKHVYVHVAACRLRLRASTYICWNRNMILSICPNKLLLFCRLSGQNRLRPGRKHGLLREETMDLAEKCVMVPSACQHHKSVALAYNSVSVRFWRERDKALIFARNWKQVLAQTLSLTHDATRTYKSEMKKKSAHACSTFS